MDIDYKSLIDNIFDGLYLVDKNRSIIYWNRVAEKITGYRAEEVIGKRCRDNILVHVDRSGKSLCLGRCPLEATIGDGQFRDAEVFLQHKDGHRVPVWIRAAPLHDTTGTIIGGAELFTDLSAGNAISNKVLALEKLSFLDPLTQLANRRYLEMELSSRIAEKNRYGAAFGLVFMDIDFFKRFNDTYGHDVGDRVLKAVARTFVNTARPSDLMGRWGGEEFIGILGRVDGDGLDSAVERIRALIEQSRMDENGQSLQVTVSIGATLARDADNADSIVKRADTLLYESKKNGRNRCTIG
ncbi:diguanylate cyclase [Desulfosarcina alkanivorans]|uniref:Diguanylate cyclase n=1 Tax=Desulfosarcina alkanivorans TaxID=571177 RepID=A0A5K7YTK6_9BACT|nr:sensor domain-containing diguanylate cyclase [Desulfosarcina alkanivorans]BBO69614.1 diguanylate cyclase [Desulfosarcina alkanivorans]